MSGDGVPDVAFCGFADAYFVVETSDGDSLHATLVGCSLVRMSGSQPGDPAVPPDGSTPREPGLYVRFKCITDGRARGYFYDRAVLGRKGGHREHDWKVEYTGHDGKTRQSRFRGTMSGYKEKEKSPNKWWFFGTIRVRMPP